MSTQYRIPPERRIISPKVFDSTGVIKTNNSPQNLLENFIFRIFQNFTSFCHEFRNSLEFCAFSLKILLIPRSREIFLVIPTLHRVHRETRIKTVLTSEAPPTSASRRASRFQLQFNPAPAVSVNGRVTAVLACALSLFCCRVFSLLVLSAPYCVLRASVN